jgi:hypothetical protein
MARTVILWVRDGDPASERARGVLARTATELGLELEVRSLDSSPRGLLPQVTLWDDTRLARDRVADEVALRDAIAARIRAEEHAAGSDASEQGAPLAPEGGEGEPFGDARRTSDEAQPTRGQDEPPSPDGDGEPSEPQRGERRTARHPRRPVLLHEARRRRRELAARVARKLRLGSAPLVIAAAFFIAFLAFGRRERTEGETARVGEVRGMEAPPLELPTIDGFRFDLARERGRAVLVVLFDARRVEPDGLATLAAEAEKATARSRGDARVVAIGVGLEVSKLRAALPDVPFALTVAADAEGRAVDAFAAASAGQRAGWWLVDRTGRLAARGERLGPEAFSALLAVAGRSGP